MISMKGACDLHIHTAPDIFTRTAVVRFSSLPSFAKETELIPDRKRSSVFDISRSIKIFHSFL